MKTNISPFSVKYVMLKQLKQHNIDMILMVTNIPFSRVFSLTAGKSSAWLILIEKILLSS